MRPYLALVGLALGPHLIGQPTADPAALEVRVRALEREVSELKNEVARLRSLELRLRALEQVLASAEGAPAPGGAAAASTAPGTAILAPAGFDDMPYGEERTFLVAGVFAEGSAAASGRTVRRLDVDLVEVPEEASVQAERLQVLGFRHLAFPKGLPPGSRRYRLVLEDLGQADATSWFEALRPETVNLGDREVVAWKQIRFARMPIRQTNTGGYEGRSGTVRTFRNGIFWHENNVMFLENGALHVLGGGAAQAHLRLVRDESLPAAGR